MSEQKEWPANQAYWEAKMPTNGDAAKRGYCIKHSRALPGHRRRKEVYGLPRRTASAGEGKGGVTYTITIPDVPPSLNVSRNLHWAAKARLRDKWILYVRSQMNYRNYICAQKPEKRHVKVVLHHSRPYDECDNMQGACKPLFDALKHWHLIHDDSPEWIGKPDISQAKCPHKKRHTVIEIGAA